MPRTSPALTASLLLLASPVVFLGQTAPSADAAHAEETRTFYLRNAYLQNDGNEVTTAIRNLLPPSTHIYYVPSQQAMIIRATPDQLAMTQKLLAELDRPHAEYRVLYTITETDGGKRIGVQHFTATLLGGQHTTLKQGSRIPIASTSRAGGAGDTENQVVYLDIGLSIDATLNSSETGGSLRTKIEVTNLAPERSGIGDQDPIVRQTLLEGTFVLTLGKPSNLGSLDVPGSTRHLDVEATLEAAK